MSRTKRKDYSDVEKKRGASMFMGIIYQDDTPDWKKYRDKKRWNKPSKAFKELAKNLRKAKEKDAMRHIPEKDLDEVIIPEFPKSDIWNWN